MRSKTNYKNQCGIYNGNSKYKNLIYCGVCGSVYHSNRDKGRIFYNCANKKLHGTAACNGVNVSEKQIDAYINWLANDIYKDNKVAINPIFKFSHKAEETVKKYGIVEQKPMLKDEVEDILKRIDNVL